MSVSGSILIAAFLVATSTADPAFKASDLGWIPSCPSGMTLVRQKGIIPAYQGQPQQVITRCNWGTMPMRQKPTQDDYKCERVETVKDLPVCPVE